MNYKSLTKEDLLYLFEDEEFQTPPMKHQLASLAFAIDGRDRVCFWHGIGTGKTLVALYTALLWGCKRIFVVCPNSVTKVWEDEIEKHTGLDFFANLSETRQQDIEENPAEDVWDDPGEYNLLD